MTKLDCEHHSCYGGPCFSKSVAKMTHAPATNKMAICEAWPILRYTRAQIGAMRSVTRRAIRNARQRAYHKLIRTDAYKEQCERAIREGR